jgi:hypothetical protein
VGASAAETDWRTTQPTERLTRLLSALVELVWRRLRVHLTLRGLLLAEPATQEAAGVWATHLSAAGVEQIVLAGPVDAARLRWEPSHWQARAARSLATLLWSTAELESGDAPAEGLLPDRPAAKSAEDTTPATGQFVPVWAIGATAWPTPAAQIRQYLSVRCAAGTVGRLLDAGDGSAGSARGGAPVASLVDDLPPWEMPGLAVAPERHRLSVNTAVPAEPAGLVWGQRRPGWHALATLPDALAATAEQRAARAHDEQYAPRGAWLAGQVTAWTAALRQLHDDRLDPPDGWSTLAQYRMELRALITQLRAACALIDGWLEEAGATYAQAEANAARAGDELAALCASFPPTGERGLLAIVTGPWHWPGLAWRYLALLPQRAQQYLDACQRRGAARWAEANLHALRQAYLAMTQIVQEQQREAETLADTLRSVAEDLARAVAEVVEAPAPWDACRLDDLAQTLIAGNGPGLGWAQAEQVRALESLQDWAAVRLASLDDWTAADWLTLPMDDVALADWLSSVGVEATALWPAAAPEAEAITWLLCPARRQGATDGRDLAEERLRAGLSAQAVRQGDSCNNLRFGVSSPDTLLILRAVKVRLEDGAPG